MSEIFFRNRRRLCFHLNFNAHPEVSRWEKGDRNAKLLIIYTKIKGPAKKKCWPKVRKKMGLHCDVANIKFT